MAVIRQLGRMVDTVYLSVWRLRKPSNALASWERDAGASIFMALPVLLLIESARQWNELGALASQVPNRVVYGLVVFVPICLITYGFFWQVNQREAPANRLESLMNNTSKTYRWICVCSYFLIPATVFVLAFFA